jgi:hypothetical protein
LTVWPPQVCSKVFTKPVIALAWAVEPLALSACLPPQVTPDACGVDPPELSSLPHALNRSAPAAIRPTAAARRWNLTEILRLVLVPGRRSGVLDSWADTGCIDRSGGYGGRVDE